MVKVLLVFWPRIVAGRNAWVWWLDCLFRWWKPEQKRADAFLVAFFAIVIGGTSVVVATVPEEPWEPPWEPCDPWLPEEPEDPPDDPPEELWLLDELREPWEL